jgi:integrase/recombinase XerD
MYIQQIINWLGEDFDGVIAFDEAHSMGNAIAVKGKRGVRKPSQQAIAGLDRVLAAHKAEVQALASFAKAGTNRVVLIPGDRDSALLEFLYGTGARVSEAVGIDLGKIDLEDRVALVTGKGSKQRLVPLGSKAVMAIARWLPDRLSLFARGQRGDPVFLNMRGRRLTRQGAFDVVRANASRAGIEAAKVSPHVLRHSAATHMVESGADLRTVQEILGHATISTTRIYTRVSATHLVEVYVQAHPRSR